MAKVGILIFILLLCACRGADNGARIVLKVGDIEVTKAEFEGNFKDSPYGTQDTGENRKRFLEAYALRLILLTQAQEYGLDRDPRFLKDVEFFWQQALIKCLLEKKMSEYAMTVKISDAEVENYFIRNQKEYFNGKNFSDCALAIRSFLAFQEENRLVDIWVQDLKSKTKIRAGKAFMRAR